MASLNNGEEGSVDRALFTKPDLRTTRRNFVAGASVLAGALLGTAVAGKTARADPSDTGCLNSDNQPFKCPPRDPVNCFLSGTRIATPDREVEIDRLRIGDLVMSISGEPRPVKWIGRRRLTRAPSETWNRDVAPVKVARFALDDQTPTRICIYPQHTRSIFMGC
jgi:hypothetical protein